MNPCNLNPFWTEGWNNWSKLYNFILLRFSYRIVGRVLSFEEQVKNEFYFIQMCTSYCKKFLWRNRWIYFILTFFSYEDKLIFVHVTCIFILNLYLFLIFVIALGNIWGHRFGYGAIWCNNCWRSNALGKKSCWHYQCRLHKGASLYVTRFQ